MAKKENLTLDTGRLMMLVTVVRRNKAEFFTDLLGTLEANLQFSMQAEGTAGEGILRSLGIPDNEKAVIFTVIRENRLPDALRLLNKQFDTLRGGKGIAFAVPFSSLIGVSSYTFLANSRPTVGGAGKEAKNRKEETEKENP